AEEHAAPPSSKEPNLSRSDIKGSEDYSKHHSRSTPNYTLNKYYEPATEEATWREYWNQRDIYHFDPQDKSRKTYSIDTPPPYPSGDFHVGNALNWCYIDFVARYKRMKVVKCHFTEGWE